MMWWDHAENCSPSVGCRKKWWDCFSPKPFFSMQLTCCWSQNKMMNVMTVSSRKKCNVTHCLVDSDRGVRLPFRKVQCHSLSIGHMSMRLPYKEKWNATDKLLVIGKDVMWVPFRKMWKVTHSLLVKRAWNFLSKKCSATHWLLIIKTWDYLSKKCAMSLTFYWT